MSPLQFNPLPPFQSHENYDLEADFNTSAPTQAPAVGWCKTIASSTDPTRSRPSPLDKLAIELLTLISFFACIDGGPTGCALSLVSKRMHAASCPARFFSVSLTTESSVQVKQFLACYQAECARATDALPRVHHLCLSLFGRGEDGTPNTPSSSNPSLAAGGTHIYSSQATQPRPTSRAAFLAQMQRQTQRWRSAQDRLDEGYSYVLPTLFPAIAPDLRTLTLIQARWRVNAAAQCWFPHLRELTLVGGDPSFLPFGFAPGGQPQYPSLRRLHHNLAFVGAGGLNFLEWATQAPNLTHSRVSRLDSHPRAIVDTLGQAIGDQAADESFPHLQHVAIQPNAVPAPSHSTMAPPLASREFLAFLERLKERAKAPVVVLPPAETSITVPGVDRHRACVMRLKRQWMERMEDEGPGCWEDGLQG